MAEKIEKTLTFRKRTNGRENIKHLEINMIAKKIIKIYEKVLRKEINLFNSGADSFFRS